jgi:heme/copper-type cytochrome/quinol oxidase subunit 2
MSIIQKCFNNKSDIMGMVVFFIFLFYMFFLYIMVGEIPPIFMALVLLGIIIMYSSILINEVTELGGVPFKKTLTFYSFSVLTFIGDIIGLKHLIVYVYSNLPVIVLPADFSTLMGFTKPGNDTMFSIIALLSEMTILLTFILFGVLIALAYIIDVYNAESNPFPRHFEKSIESTLDVLFVIFPTVIIIYLLIPSLGFIFNNETVVETVFDLDVVGHQWYWSYEYSLSIGITLYDIFADESTLFNRIEFDSLLDLEATYNRLLQVDKRVIIPLNALIRATVTSQDVIHSWAIPQLGIKYDAIPGRMISFILHSNMLGIFYGQCSELCGVNHAFTPICVQVVENDVFLDWVLCALNINPSKYILDSVYFDSTRLLANSIIVSLYSVNE